MRAAGVTVGLTALAVGVALNTYDPWAWIASGAVLVLGASLWRGRGKVGS